MENNKRKIVVDKYLVEINIDDENFIDGYMQFIIRVGIDNNLYEVFTGILNKNLEFVVPLRKEIVAKDALDIDEYYNHIALYKNKKCVYVDKKGGYIIDLDNTKFTKKDDLYVPDNYIIKFDEIYEIGNGKAIILNYDNSDDTNSFIYDIEHNHYSSNIYNLITPSKEYQNMYDAYINFKDKNNQFMQAQLLIDDAFDIESDVLINGIVETTLPYYVLADPDLIKDALEESYNYLDYILKEDDKKTCKRLIH